MKVLGIEHIGIAVKSVSAGKALWQDVLGIEFSGLEKVSKQGVNTAIYDTGRGKVELLEATREDSPIAGFLAKRGEGIHHVCLEVDDIYGAIDKLKKAGIRIIYDEPQAGADNMLITFLHPSETNGVLIELAQKADR